MSSHESEPPGPPSLGDPPSSLPPHSTQEDKSPSEVDAPTPISITPPSQERSRSSSPIPPTDGQTVPDIWRWMKDQIYRRGGTPGLILVFLLVGISGLWWNWPTIQTLPGVSSFLSQMTPLLESSLPSPDPKKFSVAVAHLQHDQGEELERLVVESLQEFGGIHVDRFDRMILSGDIGSEETIQAGHHKARENLAASGFDAVIWGTVLKHGHEYGVRHEN